MITLLTETTCIIVNVKVSVKIPMFAMIIVFKDGLNLERWT